MVPGFLIFLAYVVYVAVSRYNRAPPTDNDEENQDEPPTSLELIKVTFWLGSWRCPYQASATAQSTGARNGSYTLLQPPLFFLFKKKCNIFSL
jgi:hypothetical protein